MPIIGGDVAAMQATALRFAGTGTETSARGAEVGAFARSQQAEYDRLAAALVAHMTTKAAECRSQAAAMRGAFESTQWFGASQTSVSAAEAELQATLNRVLDDAGATAEQFKTRLAAFVAGFEEEAISGRLLPAMDSLRQTYEGLAAATRHVADGFAQVDGSVRMG
jgi:uncharacterized protein YukE